MPAVIIRTSQSRPSARRFLPLASVLALLCLLALPAGASAFYDDFDDSVSALPEGTGKDWSETHGANLATASKETGEPDHAGFPGGHSRWLSWSMYHDEEVQASACGANGADLLIAVYTGSALNELTEVASQSVETENGCVLANFSAEKGVTYRIAVDAKASPGTTSMWFRMKSFAPNDDFADAVVLTKFPTTVEVDPELATTELSEPDHPGKGGGNSVWYRWTPTESGFARIYNCDYWDGARFAVYTGSALSELTPVTAGKGGGSQCGDWEEARFLAEKGTTYSIAVEGYAGKSRDLSVSFGWVSKHLLTVSRSGSGGGTVVSEPVGIECGGSCQMGFYRPANLYKETPVVLTAVPDPGSVFVGWSGDECGGTEPVCEFNMYVTDVAVDAEFEDVTPELAGPPSQPGSDLSGSTTPAAPSSPMPSADPSPRRSKPKCAKRTGRGKGKKTEQAPKRRACKR